MTHRSATGAGLLLGLGLGGFVDSIVVHQLLEWHHLLSVPYPPTTGHHLRINTIADGLFHAVCLALVVVGIYLLAGTPVDRRHLSGLILAGWGTFNLVEGLVDHHLLNLHHVRPGPDQLAYDLGFLTIGLALVAVGTAIARGSPVSQPVPADSA